MALNSVDALLDAVCEFHEPGGETLVNDVVATAAAVQDGRLALAAPLSKFEELLVEADEDRRVGSVDNVTDRAVAIVRAVEEVVDHFIVHALVRCKPIVGFDGAGKAHALLAALLLDCGSCIRKADGPLQGAHGASARFVVASAAVFGGRLIVAAVDVGRLDSQHSCGKVLLKEGKKFFVEARKRGRRAVAVGCF